MGSIPATFNAAPCQKKEATRSASSESTARKYRFTRFSAESLFGPETAAGPAGDEGG
jgi:hypothetical protein